MLLKSTRLRWSPCLHPPLCFFFPCLGPSEWQVDRTLFNKPWHTVAIPQILLILLALNLLKVIHIYIYICKIYNNNIYIYIFIEIPMSSLVYFPLGKISQITSETCLSHFQLLCRATRSRCLRALFSSISSFRWWDGCVWKCCVPRKTQWFCWSWNPYSMAISLGILTPFSDIPRLLFFHVGYFCWVSCCFAVLFGSVSTCTSIYLAI